MGIKQLYNDNLRKLPHEYADVSVMVLNEIKSRGFRVASLSTFDFSTLYYITSYFN